MRGNGCQADDWRCFVECLAKMAQLSAQLLRSPLPFLLFCLQHLLRPSLTAEDQNPMCAGDRVHCFSFLSVLVH